MSRQIFIGDIHGCFDTLKKLIASICPSAGDSLIFTGDYIDRGPDSFNVIKYLISLNSHISFDCVFLKGNHEQMMIDTMEAGGGIGLWYPNGGDKTVESYCHGLNLECVSFEGFLNNFPDSHREFLNNLQDMYVTKDVVAVHAGLKPTFGLHDQDPDEVIWIRTEFLEYIEGDEWGNRTIIHGHTPNNSLMPSISNKRKRINLDSGMGKHGDANMTAYILDVGFIVVQNEDKLSY